MHLPKVAEKTRPPRMMQIRFPLGRTFGGAYDTKLHKSIVKKLLQFAASGKDEELVKLAYRWKK